MGKETPKDKGIENHSYIAVTSSMEMKIYHH